MPARDIPYRIKVYLNDDKRPYFTQLDDIQYDENNDRTVLNGMTGTGWFRNPTGDFNISGDYRDALQRTVRQADKTRRRAVHIDTRTKPPAFSCL